MNPIIAFLCLGTPSKSAWTVRSVTEYYSAPGNPDEGLWIKELAIDGDLGTGNPSSFIPKEQSLLGQVQTFIIIQTYTQTSFLRAG